ncbi:MAG: lipopolysaccharide biosynthesis protein [Ruminococcus sp.]|nr:lipopolysaccharide biosynthesis protein [Ruminococcus sp.]
MEMNVKDIVNLLLSRIKLILLITVLCTAAGFCFAKFVLPLKYTSSIKIYVKSTNSAAATEGISYSEITAAKSLASTYIVILDDRSVYEEVSKRLIQDYDTKDLANYFTIKKDDDGNEYIPEGQLQSIVNISSVNDTEVLQVSCTSEVPKFAADICTYISDLAPDLIKRVTQAGSVETVSPAKVPVSPSGPNLKLITMVGCLAGLVISIALVIIMDYFDNAVTGGEEIKARFNVPILAEIPDIFMDEKGAGKYAKYSK